MYPNRIPEGSGGGEDCGYSIETPQFSQSLFPGSIFPLLLMSDYLIPGGMLYLFFVCGVAKGPGGKLPGTLRIRKFCVFTRPLMGLLKRVKPDRGYFKVRLG
jgi:hypothetical protein